MSLKRQNAPLPLSAMNNCRVTQPADSSNGRSQLPAQEKEIGHLTPLQSRIFSVYYPQQEDVQQGGLCYA